MFLELLCHHFSLSCCCYKRLARFWILRQSEGTQVHIVVESLD